MHVAGNRVSLKRKVTRKGSGLLNTIINKLPVELHIPGYRFCGPGTKLEERLRRGDKGVNVLDEACKEHDIAYSKSKELSKRHEADEKLYEKAVGRVKSKDAGLGEKLSASLIAGTMKAKTKLGMGVRGRISVAIKNAVRSGNKKRRSSKRGVRRRMVRIGGAMTFVQAMNKARNAIRRIGKKKGILENAKVAYGSLMKSKLHRILPPRSRIIPIPKKGGFLPLIPLFAALGALGSLGGGAAAVAKAVNDAKAAREQLAETNRHNKAMESRTVGGGLYVKPYKIGCGVSIGSGLYVKPYKSGCGVFLPKESISKN